MRAYTKKKMHIPVKQSAPRVPLVIGFYTKPANACYCRALASKLTGKV